MFLALIVFLIVLGLVAWLVSLIPMDPTIAQVIRVAFIIVAVLAVCDAIGLTHFGVISWLPINR